MGGLSLARFNTPESAPTGGEIDMSLSLSTTSRGVSGRWPAWLMASSAMPPVRAPSPITATHLNDSPRLSRAIAMPSAAEMDVLA